MLDTLHFGTLLQLDLFNSLQKYPEILRQANSDDQLKGGFNIRVNDNASKTS